MKRTNPIFEFRLADHLSTIARYDAFFSGL